MPEKCVPAIPFPSGIDRNLERMLAPIKETLDIWAGRQGDELCQVITLEDLLNSDITIQIASGVSGNFVSKSGDTMTGRLTVDVAPGGYTPSDISILFGDEATDGNIYAIGQLLNSGYGANSTSELGINYFGYQGGATQYRDFKVYDGKGNALLSIGAAAAEMIFYGKINALKDTGGVYDSTTVAAIYGDQAHLQVDSVYMIGNSINGAWGGDGDSDLLRFNYRSYNGGVTKFRDTAIYDGKGNQIVFVDGSAGTIDVSPDTDTVHQVGRFKIAYTWADVAAFGHVDRVIAGDAVNSGFFGADANGSLYAYMQNPFAFNIGFNGGLTANFSSNGLQLQFGGAVNYFTDSTTLVGDSSTSVPTEHAVKTYVDSKSSWAADTDVQFTFGRARIGDVVSLSDYAGFSHYDHASLTNYALVQYSNGNTFLNAPTGASVSIRNNNIDSVVITDDSITAFPDVDTTHTFGRAIVGHLTGVNDYAAFTHYDRVSSTSYGFLVFAGGATFMNSTAGHICYIRSNNVSIIEAQTGQVDITGDVDIVGDLVTNGKITAEVDTGGIYDATTVSAIFGDTDSTDNMYFIGNTLQGNFGVNANAGWWVNYRGYNGGTTQFRDFFIGNGKGGQIALFDGSTARFSVGNVNPPQSKLHVYDGIAGEHAVYVENVSSANGAISAIKIKTADSGVGYILIGDPGATSADIANRLDIFANTSVNGVSIVAHDASGDIRAYTGGRTNERFRITAAGEVMIYQSSGYLNFGTTAGSSGYGFRDNSGVMEVKDSGGSWLPILPAYGEIYCQDSATTISVSTAGWTQVTNFDTNGNSSNTTPDHTNDHITIVSGYSGKYMCTVSIAVENSAGTSHIVEFSVFKNNGATEFTNVHAHRSLSAGSDIGSISLSGIIDLAASDTIELWATSDSAAARNITVSDCTLTLVQIG